MLAESLFKGAYMAFKYRLLSAAVLLSSTAWSAAPAQTSEIDARRVLDEAIAARAEAKRALEAADRAIAAAQALIGPDSVKAPSSLPDAVAQGSTSTEPPFDPSAKVPEKAILCRADAGGPLRVVTWPDAYRKICLQASKHRDLNVTDLNFRIEGTKDSAAVEVVPAYTFRWRTSVPGEDAGVQLGTSYFRMRGGARVYLDSGGNANFADLTAPDVVAGTEGIAGIEFGGTLGRRNLDSYVKKVREALVAARQACLAEALSTPRQDPLNAAGASLGLRDEAQAIAVCDEGSLSDWMTKKKATYYHALIPPLWDAKSGMRFYAGVQGTYAKPEFAFFPLIDPAGVGIPLDPNAYPDGQLKERESVYSVKGYGGLVFSELAAAGLSLSYRRDFKYPKGTKDQTVCREGGEPYIRCASVNIGPPYELKGFVIGGRGALAIPRLYFLPPLGVEVLPSYALDVKQFGVVASLFFATDREGKTKSGIRVGCTSAGETDTGFPLQKDCKASVFFGTELNLEGRP